MAVTQSLPDPPDARPAAARRVLRAGARTASSTYRFGSDDGADDYVSLSLGACDRSASDGHPQTPDAVEIGVALWFYVDDVDAAFAALDRRGRSRACRSPPDMPWGERVAQVRDPDGNLVNLGAEPA